MNRRNLIATSITVLGSALAAGCASGIADRAAIETNAASGPTPFTLPSITIPVVGSAEVFPVRRIYCIGRNYAAHAREMGNDPTREPPFFFQKPTDAIQYVAPGKTADHPYSSLTKNYHYEIELVAALKSGGKNIAMADALSHVYGYAVGMDMTRRDLQRGMGDEKKPWEIGKSFDMSAPVGPIHRVRDVGHFTQGGITLSANGTVKQKANLSFMILSVASRSAN